MEWEQITCVYSHIAMRADHISINSILDEIEHFWETTQNFFISTRIQEIKRSLILDLIYKSFSHFERAIPAGAFPLMVSF